jgi:NADPH:quinone reductase-like Zn-dependent oxidoreductase
MKAYVYERFGPPEVLELREVKRPEVGDGEVLVRVRAVSLDYGTWLFVKGEPLLVRLMAGPFRPRIEIPGHDFAGTVEAIGRGVGHVRPGDEVYGEHRRAFAELVCAPADSLALKPANLSFEEAAAVPVSGLTALQGLRDHARVRPGDRVLINGASGGVGTFAVQVARVLGAHVTGVCSPRNQDLVRSIGADDTIDYTQQDFTQGETRYDVIFDLIGNRTLAECRRVLTRTGTLLPSAGPPAPTIRRMLGGALLSPFISQRIVTFVGTPRRRDLDELRSLIEAGSLRPVIDRRYTFAELPLALQHQDDGHARGKKVITVASESGPPVS